MNGSAAKVCNLLASAHHARMEVLRIEREMRACVCQHELALEHCESSVVGDGSWWRQLNDRDGQPYRREDQNGKVLKDWLPCWKGEMVPSGNPYPLPSMEWEAYGWSDERPGGWCDPCCKRETIRKGLEPARRRLAGLKSAIWAAAKKCAEEVKLGRPSAGAVGRRRVRVSEVDPKICRRIRREVLRRGLDRRKVYCLTMDGEVGTLERFTDVCSGCRCDCGDGYPCSHGAGGCDECGYTGKRIIWFGVPVATDTTKPLSAYRRADRSQAKRIAGSWR